MSTGDDRGALAAARRLEVFLGLRDGSSAHDKDLRKVISALRAASTATEQGEPSDAQVEALAKSNYEFQNAAAASPSWESRAEWLKDAYREEARVGLRAALRAAAAVREEGQGR